MSGILTQLKILTQDLNELNVNWALVGALAASVYTEPRTTRDIDVSILAPNREAQEILIQELLKRGYLERQELVLLSPICKLGVRLQLPAKQSPALAVDFLFSATGIEREIVESSISIEIFPKIFMPVASLAHVLAMKILSKNEDERIKDYLDIQLLLKIADDNDILTARQALSLIQERGYSRGKNLLEEFEIELKKYK